MARKKQKKEEKKKEAPTQKEENALEKASLNPGKWNIFKESAKRHKKHITISALALIICGIILFAFLLYLYIHLRLGNDVLIQLSVDKDALHLLNSEEENITFTASVSTNLFCIAECSVAFRDLSSGTTVDAGKFTLHPATPMKKTYTMQAPLLGEGVLVYRFEMECASRKTFLCQSSQKSYARKLLVTMHYERSEEQEQLRIALKQRLEQHVAEVNVLAEQIAILADVLVQNNSTLDFITMVPQANALKGEIMSLNSELASLQDIWDSQEYALLAQKEEDFSAKREKIAAELLAMNIAVLHARESYNVLVDELAAAREDLLALQEAESLLSDTQVPIEAYELGRDFEFVLQLFSQASTLEKKQELVEKYRNKTETVLQLVNEQLKETILEREINADMSYDLLCNVTSTCIAHPSIEERADQTLFSVNKTCAAVAQLHEEYLKINRSLTASQENASGNASSADEKIRQLQQAIARHYFFELPSNRTNTDRIKSILQAIEANATEEAEFNNTRLLVSHFRQYLPLLCRHLGKPVQELELTQIVLHEPSVERLQLVFAEPVMQCCLFNTCTACCDKTCQRNSSLDPVILVHGHSFNEKLSADYSPEQFTGLQNRLEQDGFVNAGMLSLYRALNSSPSWDLFPVPLTLKVSYYYDLYKQPESFSFVLIQSKDENLDTYAIRLKDIIDDVKRRTQREKVNIVSHSMGGLVVRRYIQIFGEKDIDRIVFIAVPHKGISERIYKLCNLKGSKRACTDMKAGSLFLNKLNAGALPSIPITNIVGTGCGTDSSDGDGVVTRASATLGNASNIHTLMVNGTCSGLQLLHNALLDIEEHPEVYDAVRDALKG
ncbi:MAG: alpha/beta hydrolase [Nanoarchaeota archaeon]